MKKKVFERGETKRIEKDLKEERGGKVHYFFLWGWEFIARLFVARGESGKVDIFSIHFAI